MQSNDIQPGDKCLVIQWNPPAEGIGIYVPSILGKVVVAERLELSQRWGRIWVLDEEISLIKDRHGNGMKYCCLEPWLLPLKDPDAEDRQRETESPREVTA